MTAPAGLGPLARSRAIQLSGGVGVLLTDHNVRETLSLCDRTYVLHDGVVLAAGRTRELVTNPDVRRRFLGESFDGIGLDVTTPQSAANASTGVALVWADTDSRIPRRGGHLTDGVGFPTDGGLVDPLLVAETRESWRLTMSLTQHEFRHLRRALGIRGFLLLVLGLGAVIWPETLLVGALILVGLIATLSGIYELSIAAALRSRTVHWRVALFDGVASLLFGALTMGVARLSHFAALALTTGWLILYAGFAWRTSTIVWPRRVARVSLIVWGAVNILFAILAAYPEGTVFALLFFGAAYAALYGAWQLAIALWLRRWLGAHTGVLPRALTSRGTTPAPSRPTSS